MSTTLHRVRLLIQPWSSVNWEVYKALEARFERLECFWSFYEAAWGEENYLEVIIRVGSTPSVEYDAIRQAVLQELEKQIGVVHGIDVTVKFVAVAEARNPIADPCERERLDQAAVWFLNEQYRQKRTATLDAPQPQGGVVSKPSSTLGLQMLRRRIVRLLVEATEMSRRMGELHRAAALWSEWTDGMGVGLEVALDAQFALHAIATELDDRKGADVTYLEICRTADRYESGRAWLWIARHEHAKGHEDAALNAVRRCLEFDPQSESAALLLEELGGSGLDADDGRVEIDEGPRTRPD